MIEQPVVEGALVFELQRADAVGDVLQRVLNGVGEGVHGVDAPGIARVVVRGAADAVDGRVAQVDVGRGHVDLGAQHGGTVGQQAVFHVGKALQVLGHAAVAVGAVFAGGGEVAPVGAHVFGRLLIDIGQALLNQVDGCAVHEVKVVAGVVQVAVALRVLPVKAEPAHGIFDAFDVFLFFFFGVGVVKAQVANAVVIAGQAKVQANAFGVAHVQVAVGLGRKARADFGRIHGASGMVGGIARAAAPVATRVGAFGQVVFDDLAQEVGRLGRHVRSRRGVGGIGAHMAADYRAAAGGTGHTPGIEAG